MCLSLCWPVGAGVTVVGEVEDRPGKDWSRGHTLQASTWCEARGAFRVRSLKVGVTRFALL